MSDQSPTWIDEAKATVITFVLERDARGHRRVRGNGRCLPLNRKGVHLFHTNPKRVLEMFEYIDFSQISDEPVFAPISEPLP